MFLARISHDPGVHNRVRLPSTPARLAIIGDAKPGLWSAAEKSEAKGGAVACDDKDRTKGPSHFSAVERPKSGRLLALEIDPGGELVTHAAYGFDQLWRLGIYFDLFPQFANQNIDASIQRQPITPTHQLGDLLTA